ncbi:probable chitinase 10 [Paramacrobiotus metropolitanus]|uniref:probable chitinase 10 n=1 Tax=Paramacrobiotus metropolitanus TaxID=2943436 RepID=UPI0024464FDB|nr:probable chitinase 10 [Paramacrobiotus metropolitanus]
MRHLQRSLLLGLLIIGIILSPVSGCEEHEHEKETTQAPIVSTASTRKVAPVGWTWRPYGKTDAPNGGRDATKPATVKPALTTKAAPVITTAKPVVTTTKPTTRTTTIGITTEEVVTEAYIPADRSPISYRLKGRKELGCYFQNYAIYRPGGSELKPDKIDPNLCTFIIYFIANLISNTLQSFDPWADIDLGGFQKINDLKKQNPDLRIVVATGGWNMGSKVFSRLAKDPNNRKKFITSVINFCDRNGFDGLDLDWEYPTQRGGITDDYYNFPTLLMELRQAFDQRTAETGKDYMLTAALGASALVIDNAYDVEQMFKYLDYGHIMAYDFHGTWDVAPQTLAHHSPLYTPPKLNDPDPNYDVRFSADWAIQHYLARGAPASKVLLGVPLYGRGYNLADPNRHTLGSPASGPNAAGPFLKEQGFLGITELCLNLKNNGWVKGSEYNLTYAYGQGQWVGYDDEDRMQDKAKYIWQHQLGGGFVWALDYEDNNNLCGKGKNPTISVLKKSLDTAPPGQLVVIPPPPPVRVTKPPLTVEESGMTFAKKELGCYFQDYAIYRPGGSELKPDKIDPDLCTFIIYFVGNLVNNQIKSFDPWADVDLGGFKKVNALKNLNPDLRVLIAIGGWNMGSTVFSNLAMDPEKRKFFINTTFTFLDRWNFDGLDIDWEYPTQRGGIKDDFDNFATWVKEIREAFDEKTKQTGKTYMLTAALGASTWVIDDAYNVSEIFKYLDFANIMTYDFHGTWDVSPQTLAHHSPLYTPPQINDPDPNYNLKYSADWAIQHYLALGAPASKLLLGVPLYGRGWKLADPDQHKLGSPTKGPNDAGPFLREAGFLGVTEICLNMKNKGWKKDSEYNLTYVYGDGQWVGYDDELSVQRKAKYVWDNQLAGAFVWALDYEDNNQLCGMGRNPILNALKDALLDKPTGLWTPAPTPWPIVATRPPPLPILPSTINNPAAAAANPPAPGATYLCQRDGFFQVPTDCTKFIRCVTGQLPAEFSCSAGLLFDESIQSCNWPQFVGCSSAKKNATTTANKVRLDIPSWVGRFHS